MSRLPDGSTSISNASWLAVTDHVSRQSDADTRANGWPFLSSCIPAAPGVSILSMISTGQYPVGTSSRVSKSSTVAEICQIGERSREACFCIAAATLETSLPWIIEDLDTSAIWRISADTSASQVYIKFINQLGLGYDGLDGKSSYQHDTSKAESQIVN